MLFCVIVTFHILLWESLLDLFEFLKRFQEGQKHVKDYLRRDRISTWKYVNWIKKSSPHWNHRKIIGSLSKKKVCATVYQDFSICCGRVMPFWQHTDTVHFVVCQIFFSPRQKQFFDFFFTIHWIFWWLLTSNSHDFDEF